MRSHWLYCLDVTACCCHWHWSVWSALTATEVECDPLCVSPSGTVRGGFEYQEQQKHSVLFYHEDSADMYVGGTDFVLKLDMNDNNVKEVGACSRVKKHSFLTFLFSFHPFIHKSHA